MIYSNLHLEAFGLRLNKEETELIQPPLSSLGTPILQPITFLAKRYETLDNLGIRDLGYWVKPPRGTANPVVVGYDNFTLPASSIATFTRQKFISKTALPNALSTIKEIYGFDDYRIIIRGFCLPETNHPQGFKTAIEQENELKKWDEVMGTINVKAEHFNGVRNIHSITIESVEFPSLRGKPNIRPFIIRALATLPDEENTPKI